MPPFFSFWGLGKIFGLGRISNADRAAAPPLDVGERPQWLQPRGAGRVNDQNPCVRRYERLPVRLELTTGEAHDNQLVTTLL